MTASAHALVALASSGPSPLWYATRATGTVAVLLLTATVALGIAAGGRYAPQRIARFEVSSLHRNLSLLTLAFLGLHIATAVSDSYTSIGWPAAFIPLASSYQPLWVGLGAIALDLLLAVAVTSALRHRLGRRRWKAVHWLAYGAWPVALFHAVGTGTDTRLGPQLLLYAACLATVLAAVGWRIARTTGGAARRARVWGPPASVRVPVTLGASGENHEGEGRGNE
jgi:sulfoxide reductase heme-binding subunit YedZ